ncbi:MAG: hypothetical protein WBH36_16700, partial [Syntrophobacteria bacterium]
PTGLPSEDQWGFLFFYSPKILCPALTVLQGASTSKLGTHPQGGESERTISNKEFRTAEVFEKKQGNVFHFDILRFLVLRFCGLYFQQLDSWQQMEND